MVLSSVQAGVVGLLKGSQVARFALPAPEASTAASSAPAVPAQASSAAASSSSVQYAHPVTPQPPPAGTPTASQPPPAKTPKDATATPQSQQEAASSAATPPALASTSGQQSRYPHTADDVCHVSAQTDSATSRTQAGASTSGQPLSHVKGAASSEQASTEGQPAASQIADQAKSDSAKPDSVRPAPSKVQPQQQQQPPASSAAAAADEASAEAVNAGSAALGNSGEAARSPQQSQSQAPAQIEVQSGLAETVASDTAGSPVVGSEPQLEAAGAKPGSASRAFERDLAHSAQEAEQPPAESSEPGTGSALQDQQAQSDQEADPDVQARSQTGTGTSELTTRTGTGAEADSCLTENKAEGDQEVPSMSRAVRGPAGPSKESKDHMSLHDPSADASIAAGSASKQASGDQAGPEMQGGRGAQQKVQQVTERAAAELLQSSVSDHDAMLSGKEQQMPSVRPPVLAREEIISNRSMQETSEEPPRGAVSTSPASSKQSQGQVAGDEGRSASSTAVESTSGKQAKAVPASSGVDLPNPPASLKGKEKHSAAPAVPASRVATVRSDAPSAASRSHAVSSSATARNTSKHPNESQEKEIEAQVLSPKGSSKSRQTVEMKRQQTSFNPLG